MNDEWEQEIDKFLNAVGINNIFGFGSDERSKVKIESVIKYCKENDFQMYSTKPFFNGNEDLVSYFYMTYESMAQKIFEFRKNFFKSYMDFESYDFNNFILKIEKYKERKRLIEEKSLAKHDNLLYFYRACEGTNPVFIPKTFTSDFLAEIKEETFQEMVKYGKYK